MNAGNAMQGEWCEICDAPNGTHNQDCVIVLTQRAEQAEKACAQMRKLLAEADYDGDVPGRLMQWHHEVVRVLGTGIGHGYLSPAEVKELVGPLLNMLGTTCYEEQATAYAREKGWA